MTLALPEQSGSSRILLVDDQESNVRALQKILRSAGYEALRSTTDPRQVMPLFIEFQPDLIVLDLHMPVVDGFKVLEQLQPWIPPRTFLPILVLTGDTSTAAKRRALSMGAKDFLSKPFDVTEVLLRIRNLLQTRSLHLLLEDQNRDLEARVIDRTRELDEAQIEMLQRLAAAAEVRDDDTGQHTQRVGEISGRLARCLGLLGQQTELIRRAAPLHDLGKIGIPDTVLLKPGRLTDEEFDLIKSHTLIGARILGGGRSDLVKVAERIALSHHERWDGTGYPQGLAGETIPLEARIVAVADFFDALTHERPYRPAWAIEAVLRTIVEQRGRHFDPRIAETFLQENWSSFLQPRPHGDAQR